MNALNTKNINNTQHKTPRFWQYKGGVAMLLLPLTLFYCLLAFLHKILYKYHIKKTFYFPIPVIVVGNITVGGSGKTPMVIYLVKLLQKAGYKVGVVSRGYGRLTKDSQIVTVDKSLAQVGDEPLLIVSATQCPMIVDKKRAAGVKRLLEEFSVEVVITDDGLQHYALGRSFEIIMLNHQFQLGNGWCLPSGPLRERKIKLKQADILVYHGKKPQDSIKNDYYTHLIIDKAICLSTGENQNLALWRGQKVHAIAGIAYPEGFFRLLQEKGLQIIPHAFPDHYMFQAEDLIFTDDLPIVMTAKDAVKYQAYAEDKHWYIPLEIELPEKFDDFILQHIKDFYAR